MLLPRRVLSATLGVFMFVFVVAVGVSVVKSTLNPFYWLAVTFGRAHEKQTPPTTHIVLFQFKAGISNTAVKEVTAQMLGLKKACKHPSTRSSYIKSITGGKDTSIEGLQDGISHAFILQFQSAEDRNYYVENDPVHQAFKDAVANVVEKVQVVDFQEGIFF